MFFRSVMLDNISFPIVGILVNVVSSPLVNPEKSPVASFPRLPVMPLEKSARPENVVSAKLIPATLSLRPTRLPSFPAIALERVSAIPKEAFVVFKIPCCVSKIPPTKPFISPEASEEKAPLSALAVSFPDAKGLHSLLSSLPLFSKSFFLAKSLSDCA